VEIVLYKVQLRSNYYFYLEIILKDLTIIIFILLHLIFIVSI